METLNKEHFAPEVESKEVVEGKIKYIYPPTGEIVEGWHTHKWLESRDYKEVDFNEYYMLVEVDGKRYTIKKIRDYK